MRVRSLPSTPRLDAMRGMLNEQRQKRRVRWVRLAAVFDLDPAQCHRWFSLKPGGLPRAESTLRALRWLVRARGSEFCVPTWPVLRAYLGRSMRSAQAWDIPWASTVARDWGISLSQVSQYIRSWVRQPDGELVLGMLARALAESPRRLLEFIRDDIECRPPSPSSEERVVRAQQEAVLCVREVASYLEMHDVSDHVVPEWLLPVLGWNPENVPVGPTW